MGAMPPPELRPDDPLTADWLNQLLAYFDSGSIRSVDADSGLVGSQGPGGWDLGIQATPMKWVKITWVGPSGTYSWREQVPAPGSGWTDGPTAGYCQGDPARPPTMPADPAVEANGNAAVGAGKIVDGYRDPAVGRLNFRGGAC
jgi:hypothetical protein